MRTRVVPILAALLAGGAALALGVESAQAKCQLGTENNPVKHVVHVTFDNFHFRRDNPNVPSDLEQVPSLLNFIEGRGTLLGNHHTDLISHTATGILTALTGVYPDRMGQPVSNSFRYFKPDGSTATGVSFAYWTAPLFDPANPTVPTDTTPTMINEAGVVAPAPWVPYTRAGCDVGAVASANIILENIAIDIPTVFGPNSPEAAEVKSNPGQAFADFVGIGIHCAKGSALCAAGNAKPDALPDEPGGYNGYQALFGHKSVAPAIASSPLTDINGKVIKDEQGHVGFPGFDGMEAPVSLGYVAQMLEAGVPVVYAYISDAHDKNIPAATKHALGPGEVDYENNLKSYEAAFHAFFQRLKAAGIDETNTVFVFTADEGDHFAGGPPSPANCDGVTVPCTYPKIGEVNGDLSRLVATQFNNKTPFTVHSDSAPAVYITGNPSQTSATTRQLERDFGGLVATNPITGNQDTLTVAMVDHADMGLLHMLSKDPARTPTFIMFANPDYFLFASGKTSSCAGTTQPACIVEQPGFAWNHGDIQQEIANNWLGMVGPGIRNDGLNKRTWSDHTDIRPTLLTVLGLKDDYTHDGRVLVEHLEEDALPRSLRHGRGDLVRLAQVYKQLNAPFGAVGLASLPISTKALKGDDATYAELEKRIGDFTRQRDAVASAMIALLDGAAFNGGRVEEKQVEALIGRAGRLIADFAGFRSAELRSGEH